MYARRINCWEVARVLAAGSPAKVKKEISGEALNWIKMGSSTYVNLCRSYLSGDYKLIK